MIVILEDKQNDIEQAFFYDRVLVGAKLRAFGSATKLDENPIHLPRTARQERLANMVRMQPEQLLTKRADNYRRWFGTDWAFIELCGPTHGNDWSAAAEAPICGVWAHPRLSGQLLFDQWLYRQAESRLEPGVQFWFGASGNGALECSNRSTCRLHRHRSIGGRRQGHLKQPLTRMRNACAADTREGRRPG